MSPLTRYGFAALIAIFGIYQIGNGHPVAAVIAFALAVIIAWLGRGG